MSAVIQGIPVIGRASTVLTKPGQLAKVIGPVHVGSILLCKHGGYVSLTGPSHTWDKTCSLEVEVLPPGTVVIYTSEV